MKEERLLERLQNTEKNPGSRIENDLPRKVNSIMGHLQNLLNTHQGSVPIADDYGIPDITNTQGESVTEMTRRIELTLQDVIKKYEPRLAKVKVMLISQKDEVLSLRFKLEAVLITENSTPVVLETVVSTGGKINVISS